MRCGSTRSGIENAIKYTPERATICVSARSHGRKIAIEVADDGAGVAPETRKAIFDGRGGLGLAICRAIADAHGGTISLHGRATFRIELPAHRAGS